MPDTSAAREAIHAAYERHRDIMGGMSMAMLKLEAAGGLLRPNPLLGDNEPLPYPEDSPVWLEHASAGLQKAYKACGALREAIIQAQDAVAQLIDARRSPSGDTEKETGGA